MRYVIVIVSCLFYTVLTNLYNHSSRLPTPDTDYYDCTKSIQFLLNALFILIPATAPTAASTG